MISRKGVYPYNYMDSIKNFEELPPKDKLYSKLNDCDISEDYEHALKAWKEFKMEMMGD